MGRRSNLLKWVPHRSHFIYLASRLYIRLFDVGSFDALRAGYPDRAPWCRKQIALLFNVNSWGNYYTGLRINYPLQHLILAYGLIYEASHALCITKAVEQRTILFRRPQGHVGTGGIFLSVDPICKHPWLQCHTNCRAILQDWSNGVWGTSQYEDSLWKAALIRRLQSVGGQHNLCFVAC
jgi:hypothetical protein